MTLRTRKTEKTASGRTVYTFIVKQGNSQYGRIETDDGTMLWWTRVFPLDFDAATYEAIDTLLAKY